MLAALVLATALSGAPALTAPALKTTPFFTHSRCRSATRPIVLDRAAPAPRRLDELPPAIGIRLVNKSVDGCPVLVLMQRGADGKPLERGLAAPPRIVRAGSDAQGGRQRQR